MRFQIKSNEVELLKGVSQKNGRPYEMAIQEVLMHHNDEVRKVRLTLQRGQTPFAPGMYVMDPASFVVNAFGDLQIRLRLLPAPLEARKVG